MNILEYPFIVIVICKTPVKVSTSSGKHLTSHSGLTAECVY